MMMQEYNKNLSQNLSKAEFLPDFDHVSWTRSWFRAYVVTKNLRRNDQATEKNDKFDVF